MSERALMRAVSETVRAYFAPVNRTTNTPIVFDPAKGGNFSVDAPPVPWIPLGTIADFSRSALSEVAALATGTKGSTRLQARRKLAAEIAFEFREWGKLQMALACGSQQMNLLAEAAGATPRGSGSTAAAKVALQAGSTASELVVGATAVAQFAVGDIVAVDIDYSGQVGFVGSGVSAAYVKSATSVNSDPDYIRRVTFNVARVAAKTATTLQLDQSLIGGVPDPAASVQKVIGFVDREGGSFFHEWSALFVCESQAGGRVIYHYPRLQAAITAAESRDDFAKPFTAWSLQAKFRALPTTDANDGEEVLCYRSWIPPLTAALL
jgi:hypothetical protein